MDIINQKRCIIGEGPIWNENEEKLYFTNGIEGEICTYDLKNKKLDIIPFGAAAIAFDSKNRIYLSTPNGVFMLNSDNTLSVFYDTSRCNQVLYSEINQRKLKENQNEKDSAYN